MKSVKLSFMYKMQLNIFLQFPFLIILYGLIILMQKVTLKRFIILIISTSDTCLYNFRIKYKYKTININNIREIEALDIFLHMNIFILN